jgi:hypothetical protein
MPKTRSIVIGQWQSSLLVFLLLWLISDLRMNYEWLRSESKFYVTTDGQSASLSWIIAPTWGLRPDIYYCQIVADLVIRGALSDERTGLSFTTVPGSRQRSHSRSESRGTRDLILMSQIRDFIFIASLCERQLIWSSSILGKCLLIPRIHGQICCFRNTDLVSKNLQPQFAYPWTCLFNTQRWLLWKVHISAEKCLPIRFPEKSICYNIMTRIDVWCVSLDAACLTQSAKRISNINVLKTEYKMYF